MSVSFFCLCFFESIFTSSRTWPLKTLEARVSWFVYGKGEVGSGSASTSARRRSKLTNKSGDQPTPDRANVLWDQPDGCAHFSSNADAQLGVEIAVFIAAAGRDKIIIDIAALHAIEDIKQENSSSDILVLERADARGLASFPAHVVGPLDHLGVADLVLSKTMSQSAERAGDVFAHQLPDYRERQGPLPVRNVCALDAHEGEAVLLSEFDGIISVFHRFESGHFAAWRDFVDVPPVHTARNGLVIGLQENSAVAEVVKE